MKQNYNFTNPNFNQGFALIKSSPKRVYFLRNSLVLFLLIFLSTTSLFGQINRAVYLASSQDYVEIPHNNAFNFGNTFTVAFWVKPNAVQKDLTTAYNTLLVKSNGSSGGIPFGFQMVNSGVDVGKLKVIRRNSAGTDINYPLSTTLINDGKFHYIALVKTGTGANNIKLYIDNVLQGTGVNDISGTVNNNASIYLGRMGNTNQPFVGAIDELRIWQIDRSASLAADMNSVLANTTDLLAYYNMETGLKNISTASNATQSVNGFLGGEVKYIPTQKSYGNALHFDGNNDIVTLSNNPGAITNQMTVEAWIRPEKLTGTQTVASQIGKWEVKLIDGKVNLSITTSTNISLNISSNTPLTVVNQWYHISAVFNANGTNNRMELYLNGELDNSLLLTTNYLVSTAGTGMTLGAKGSAAANSQIFQGMLDEVQLWNAARTADNIITDMNSGDITVNSNHLVYFLCDQGTPNASNSANTTVNNVFSANGNGTLNNFALTGSTSNWVARAAYLNAPNATQLSQFAYNFQGEVVQNGTGSVLEEGILYSQQPTPLPASYPTANQTSINVVPFGNNPIVSSIYYKSYAFGTDGLVFSGQSTGPCVTAFPISNLSFSSGSTAVTASWTAVAGATAYDWVLTAPNGDIANSLQSGYGTSNTSVLLKDLDPGSRYYFYVRARCGGGEGEWVGPAYFATIEKGVLNADSLKNDAYVDVDWALPTGYFAQNAPLGVQLQLKSGNTLLYEQAITDYSKYQGETQPNFAFTGGGNPNYYYQVANTNSNAWPQLSQWTMETWMKTGATNTSPVILYRSLNGANNFAISLNATKKIELQVNTSVYTFDYSQIPVDQWFHLAITYQNGLANLYINGIVVSTLNPSAINVANADFQALYGANQTYMAELRFWDRVRTPNEIKFSRYIANFSGVIQNNLLLQWKWTSQAANPSDSAFSYNTAQNNAQLYQIGGGLVSNITNPAYIATPYYTAIHGTFRDYIGAGNFRPYLLSGYQIGAGTIINAVYFPPQDIGRTLAYQAITSLKADSTPFNVQLTWTNKSKLSDNFRIRRADANGQNKRTIATISGTDKIDSVLTYTHAYSVADSNLFKGGIAYRYYVDTYSGQSNKYIDTTRYETVMLPPFQLAASDNTYPNKVVLTWNNLSAFGYQIQISRDDELLETLNSTETTYTDLFPIYGKRHRYGLSLIDPTTNLPVAADYDRGGIASRGAISGIAYTKVGNYITPNVRIKLLNLSDSSQYTVMTSNDGTFSFSNLYYGKEGDFTLTADYPSNPSHRFWDVPRTLRLSNKAPSLTDVLVEDSTGFAIDTTNLSFSLSSFTAIPNPNADKVSLSCNYNLSTGDTLRANIYRGGELIQVQTLVSPTTSFTFDDLTGKPAKIYDYAITLYKLQSGIIKSLTRERENISFPSVTAPTAFTAVANATLGIVNLSWTHSSANYNGFSIYRAKQLGANPAPSDTVLIAEIAPGVSGNFAYIDKSTLPGTSNYMYVIRAKRVVENLTTESSKVLSGNLSYPALPALSVLTTTPNTSRNSMNLTWTTPTNSPYNGSPATTNNLNYNFDGFLIYRKSNVVGSATELVGLVYKEFPRSFEDKGGIPGVSYSYSVRAFLIVKKNYILNDTTVSAAISKTATYPVLKAPTTFARTNNSNNVKLTWTPAISQSTAIGNIDGQTIYWTVGTSAQQSIEIPRSASTYTFYTNVTSLTPVSFTIRSHKYIKGVKYVSNAIVGTGFATGSNPSTFPIPAQFMASQDLPEHIRLTWAYPNYILASFKIYRDGTLIAVVPTETREYYDYTAANFKSYTYEIEAAYNENTTLKAATIGKRNTLSSVQGRVYALNTNYGMPFVEVVATSTSGYYARAFTDSTGFYQIDNLPVQQSLPITLTADGANTSFTGLNGVSSATQTFLIEGERYKTYNVDFISNFSPASKDTNQFAVPLYVKGSPDPARKRTILTWTPGNQRHEGFLVYRANVLIGKVTKNAPCLLYDTEGSPGVNYLYQIWPYINGEEGEVKEVARTCKATFPKVESVIYLNAFADKANNALQLNWSHLWANHTRYEITRNGTALTTVSLPSPSTYSDTAGVPNALYNYTLTAVDENNNTLTESAPVSIQAKYPDLADITDFTLQIPTTISSPCSTALTNNHVWLQWGYASKCTGFWVYRNEELIKVLPSTELMYRDTFGTPGLNTIYTVKAFVSRNGITYSSEGLSDTTLFPAVAAPHDLTFATYTPSGATTPNYMKVQWSYSESIVTSFEIWRNSVQRGDELIYTLKVDSLGQGDFEFIDKKGIIGRLYSYKVRAIAKQEGVNYYSDFSPCIPAAIAYPSIPAPIVPMGLAATAVASDNVYATYVNLQWDYVGDNLDGFKIYRGTSPNPFNSNSPSTNLVTTLGKGMRNITLITPNSASPYYFDIVAYKIVDDQGTPVPAYSLPLSDPGGVSQPATLTIAGLAATQGTESGKVILSWTNSATYTIYREGIQIGTITGTSYTDNNAIPGKHYLYEVASATRAAVEGWAKENGYIQGKVISATNFGLYGAIVEAKTTVEGNTYYYTATSDAQGIYTLSNLYYGANPSNFTLTAALSTCSGAIEHQFLTNPQTTTLSSSSFASNTVNFIDKAQYKLQGLITRQYSSCGIEGIDVYAEYKFTDNSTTQSSRVKSDVNGNYTLDINPIQPNLTTLSLILIPYKIVNNGKDTLYFDFSALGEKEWTGAALSCLDFVTEVDFKDVLTYPVKISLINGCNQAITGGSYKVQVQSTDYCYNRSFTIDQVTGESTVNLPAMPLNIHVSGVGNLNASTLDVVEYLKYRPVVKKLDSLAAAIHPNRTPIPAAWAVQSQVTLIYHKPPKIEFKNDPFTYLCGDKTQPAIISQGTKEKPARYSIDLHVLENFGSDCEVTSGKIIIRNAAAFVKEKTLVFTNGKFPTYRFTAGSPNLVKPYTYNCYFAYYSNLGELLAEKNIAFIVTGSAQLPGSDVILDISNQDNENETDGVPIPLYVLRDPPGDCSFSSIAKGSSVTKHISLTSNLGVGDGLFLEEELSFTGVGLFSNQQLTAGATEGEGVTFDIRTTTTKEIATSNESLNVGVNGDIIGGAGLAFSYGLMKTIEVDGCAIKDNTVLGIVPSGISTSWFYTVNQIKTLVKEYKHRIETKDRVKKGGNLLSIEESRLFFQNKINNWKSILAYHTQETVPYYNLCTKRFDQLVRSSTDLQDILSGDYLSRLSYYNQWQKGFCSQIGTYSGDKFTLTAFDTDKDGINDSIPPWNNDMLTAYNNTESVLRQIVDLDYQPNGFLWEFSNDYLNDHQGKYIDQQYEALHGISAENITYSAGVNYTKTIESAKASSYSFSAGTYFHSNQNYGPYLSSDQSVGVGAETEVVNTSIKIGPIYEVNIDVSEDYEKAVDSTNTISYTLSDNEQFDQFSATIIQGIEPNQTPYFSYLGGRSSCPFEKGTISLDKPTINFIKDGAATKYDERLEVDPEGSAVFTLQIQNGNEFNLARDIQVVNILQTNPDNASIQLLGDNFADYTIYQLPPQQPFTLKLVVQRGPDKYDYENIKICVMPRCYFDDPNITYLLTTGDTVSFSVHFKKPCSSIALTEPGDNWVIQRRNQQGTNNQEALPLKVEGFDVDDNNFQSIRVEYRHIGVDNQWKTIVGSVMSKSALKAYLSTHLFPNQIPYWWYIWDITADEEGLIYPNGDYEVRFNAECMVNGKLVNSYSNAIAGKIDRNMQLIGLPEPADKIWTYGDEISISFREDVLCESIHTSDTMNFKLEDYSTLVGGLHPTIPGTVYCHNNKLSFIPNLPMSTYQGKTLKFTVKNVYSTNREVFNQETWDFNVNARDLYIDKAKFDVQIYQGEKQTLQSQFYNKSATSLAYLIGAGGGTTLLPIPATTVTDGTYSTWFTARNALNIPLAAGANTSVYFDIDAQNLAPGFYDVTFNVKPRNNLAIYDTNALTFHIEVLAKPSDWVVNPNNYENSMTVMANYQFINPTIANTDTSDLISVWINNEIRGVGKIAKIGANYLAVMSIYGNATDAGKPLNFRVWDTQTASDYDASPPSAQTFAINATVGTIIGDFIVSVDKANSKASYIPLAKGWNLFSINKINANSSLNNLLGGLKHPHQGDLIKTATQYATFDATTNTWIVLNANPLLQNVDIYHGYQLQLAQADTLRYTGAALPASLSKIRLFNGWNFIGAPLAVPSPIESVVGISDFSGNVTPTAMSLKTVALPGYAYQNMVATNDNATTWQYDPASGMNAIRPNFAYWLKVALTPANDTTNLCMSPTNACSGTMLLRTAVLNPPSFDPYDVATWQVNPSAYAYNMTITGFVSIDGTIEAQAGIKVAAYVGDECRGVSELVYIPELQAYRIGLFVYANDEDEEISFRIYLPQTQKYYKHHESLKFHSDAIIGELHTPYRFSNIAPEKHFEAAVYPNPFDRILKIDIQTEKEQNFSLTLSDLMGRVIMTDQITEEGLTKKITLKTGDLDLLQGVYLLQIKGSLGESHSFKLVHDPD